MKRPLCIYHGNCADGFGAAWVVHKFFSGEVELYAGTYQTPPPDPKGRPVIMVDFSYKRDVMLEFAKKSAGVLILDHHKSAAEDLLGDAPIINLDNYEGIVDWKRVADSFSLDAMENVAGQVYALFDMNRSGAGLAWDFFFPKRPRPRLIDHIQDRDLWRFKIPGTREVQAALFSYPYDVDVWTALIDNTDLDHLLMEGRAIERKHHKDVAELLKSMTRFMVIDGHRVPVANLPYIYTSDAGNAMADGWPFAACYWDTPEGRVFSLRSKDNGLDVSTIAAKYGGGGHRNAAGFRVTYDEATKFEIRNDVASPPSPDLPR